MLNFNMDLAAKTGTTQGYGDAWLVGYNPNVSLGVWLGYKEQKRSLYFGLERQTLHPSTRTSTLFARIMNAANEVTPELVGASSRFKQPDGVVSKSFCGISGLAASAECSAAGLVRSDLFNSKVMLPTKADDSITSSSYVLVKGVKYLAHPTTPVEFVSSGGTGVNESFIERMLGPWKGDASKLFSAKSTFASTIVSGSIFEADDVAPAPVQLTLNGTTATWSDSTSNDVIGYYVYEDGAQIFVIRDEAPKSFNIGEGSYTVRAVDITGKLSEASNSVMMEVTVPEEVIPDIIPPDILPPENGDGNEGNPPPVEELPDEDGAE